MRGGALRTTAIGALPMTLRARRPGYAVMQECLRLQSEAPTRTRAERFWGVDPVAQPARSWFKGALGERRVAAELDRLGPAFTVLHAVPVGNGSTDIDHLVIGPTGVFSINTKNHSGQRVFVGGGSFVIGGKKTSHIGAAQARDAERRDCSRRRLVERSSSSRCWSSPRIGSRSARSAPRSSCSGRTRCATGSSGYDGRIRTKPSGTCRWWLRSGAPGTRQRSCRTTRCGSSSGSIGWSARSKVLAYDGVVLRSRWSSGRSGSRSRVSSRWQASRRRCSVRDHRAARDTASRGVTISVRDPRGS